MVGTTVIAVAAILATASPPEADLSKIATELSRQPVRVECKPQSAFPGNAVGTTFHGRGLIWLLNEYCVYLKTFAKNPTKPPWVRKEKGGLFQSYLGLAAAAIALAHETWHVRGVRDEAAANCYGLQAMWRVLHGLGATAAYAKQFSRGNGPLVYGGYLPPYNSVDCRDGHKLDLNPKQKGWPQP